MSLLLGTLDGLYRVPGIEFEQPEQVLEGRCGAVHFPATDTLLARADGDLYETTNEGTSWSQIPTPDEDVSAVHLTPDGNRLYVGLMSSPVSLHVSTDWGETWTELGEFPGLPDLTHYVPQQDAMVETPQSIGFSSICASPALPERLVVGFDPAGVYVSDDGGKTWDDRSYGLSDDVHDLLVVTPTQFLAACWRGIFLTGNAGRSWAQLVTKHGLLHYDYFPSVTVHNGSIYTAAAADPPGSWGGDLGINAVLLESHDFGDRFRQVAYPGGPDECVTSLATVNEQVIGGTMADMWDGREVAEGRIIARRTTVGGKRLAACLPG